MNFASPPFAEAGPTGHTGGIIGGPVTDPRPLMSGLPFLDAVDTVRPGLGSVGVIAIALLVVALPLAWVGIAAGAVTFSVALGLLVGYLERPLFRRAIV